jgi:sugar phosphate isomerase/epimerase
MKLEKKNAISRRDALRLGVAGTGALWAAGAPRLAGAFAAAAGAKVPIGVQLYSVRKDCEKDLPQTLHALSEMGFQGVEFAGYYGHSAVELRKLLDDNGLKCCGTHIGLDTLTGDALTKTVEFNRTLGNSFLIVPSIPEERRKTADDWRGLARLFDELAGKVAPHGMRVGYHNHNFEFEPVDGSTSTPWDLFFGGTSKAVVMQVDIGNCLEGGGDPVAVLKKYPRRAATIHVKEYSKTRPDAFIGEGDVPWKAVFEACEGPGGTEWYIVEYEHESQPALPAVARCLKNLRAMGK